MVDSVVRTQTSGWRALTVGGDVQGPGTLVLRPLGMGDLLDEPFLLLRAHLRSMLLFAAVAVVPSQLLQGYLTRDAFSVFDMSLLLEDPEGLSNALSSEVGGFGGYVVVLLNALLLLPIAFALVSRLAVSSSLGERLADGQVVRATLRRAPAVAGTWLLTALAVGLLPGLGAALVGLGAVAAGGLLIVVGLPVAAVLSLLLLLAPMIAVVEGAGPTAALRRSAQLMRARFWPTVGTLSLVVLVWYGLQIGIGVLPTLFAFLLPAGWAWVLASSGAILAGLLATPYAMLVVVLVYLDALVRREALDVELLLDPPSRSGRAGA